MRLNLGCGTDIRPGYTNVDFRKTHPSVVQADLSKFPWPFETESSDEILMLDFLEHFPYRQTSVILIECHRVLKPEGELVIQVPDAMHLAHAMIALPPYMCNRCGYRFTDDSQHFEKCPECEQNWEEIARAAVKRFYGGQDYPGNFHHTCFTRVLLQNEAHDCGFSVPVYEDEAHQLANWNFKARFRKEDLWR